MVTRRTIWARWRIEQQTLAATADARVGLNTLIKMDRPGLGEYTITRTIGLVQFMATSGTRTPCGIGMITAPATVSVTQIPKPLVDFHADWMWWKSFICPATADRPNFLLFEFDLGGQRKQRELERDWSMVLRNNGTVNCDFAIGGMSLLKLA